MKIYTITNLVNQKQYVGLTTRSLQQRFEEHLLSATNDNLNLALHNAIRKYGIVNFKIEWVASATSIVNLKKLEQVLIKQLNTLAPNGYNMTNGGDGLVGYKFTSHQKVNCSKIQKQRWAKMSLEERKKIGTSISLVKKGKLYPWLNATINKGRQRSLEFKNKVSIGMKAYCLSVGSDEMARRAKLADHTLKSIATKKLWENQEHKIQTSIAISKQAKEKWKDPLQIERVRSEMKEVWKKRKAGLLPMPKKASQPK